MFDSTLLGQVAAKCMESLEKDEDVDGGKLEAVLLIAVAANDDDDNAIVRTYCSEAELWKQLGLLEIGRRCVASGEQQED